MRKQKGLSLINLLAWGIILGACLVLGLKLIPVYSEYMGIKTALKALAKDMSGAPIGEIRESFDKRATIEDIKSVQAADLDIVQDQAGTVISVTYQRVVPLVGNASLLFDFSVEERHGGSGGGE
ncbi:DUF4845 domain-containing protein [Chitinimonas viridis]|uniref:DUF4845 domain-containing protein n=1 Tax=Chitinimonas viridis TaxID=664880 RepID=A0ABT8B2C4_9NEIS|nr:DUF4845 domain-containing protein [Chitinimonas viridis]MDN3576165.1 DUF4845 domain-containing protein [Chitinimonas viridis]